jgi:hypothetical protein
MNEKEYEKFNKWLISKEKWVAPDNASKTK